MSMEKNIRFEMLARLCPNSTGNFYWEFNLSFLILFMEKKILIKDYF
jgi:hypothetical protein